MNEQELIQVNLQLPASALDGLSRLAEQLRKLTEAVSGLGNPSGMSEEIVESGSFDPERFQALRQRSEDSSAQPTPAGEAEAPSVRSDVSSHVPDPVGAGQAPESGMNAQDQDNLYSKREPAAPEMDTHSEHATREEPDEAIPVVRPAMEAQTPDAPAVQIEPDSQIPEAEDIWAKAGDAEPPIPAAQAEISEGTESPLGAGMVITAQPEPPESRWTGLTEELVTAGPAPLTAEAVSLAFQRDGRRYDNGFPLY